MLEWMEMFRVDNLKHPDCVLLVSSSIINPEKVYYYQKFKNSQIILDTNRKHSDFCLPLEIEDVNKKLKNFVPTTNAVKEMWEVLNTSMSFEKIVAVEVDHCP